MVGSRKGIRKCPIVDASMLEIAAEKHEDEWEEILQRFNEEGLDASLPDGRKLLYVWRWLVDAETNCISLRHQLDKLGKRQAEELKEIRSCMEQMCNSWEIKVSDLEDQNQKFQEQLDLSDQDTSTLLSKDLRQMLAEEGLDNIIGFPIVQQFAYMLDERANLKSQVEKEIERRRKCEQLARVVSNLPDCLKLSSSHIQRILDRQKDEYEEEIRHQQETMKHVKEQLKQVHEDELNRLHAEQARLTSELTKASEKIQELVTHIGNDQGKDTANIPWVQSILDGSHVKEMQDLKTERDHLRSLCHDQQKQMREQGESLRILERTTKQLELDNDTLAYKLSESLAQIDDLEDQLHREAVRGKRESIFKQLSGKDTNGLKNNLNKYLDNRPNHQQEPLEDQVKKLQGESTKLQEQLESVEKQLEMVTTKYQQHKERHRDKVFRLRDIQDKEQKEWKEQFEACQKELAFVRAMLGREQEWRLKMEADCRKLQSDNQHLQNGIMEKEKSEREKAFDLSVLQREMELVKASARSIHTSGSPSRRNSVWPVLSHPKKW